MTEEISQKWTKDIAANQPLLVQKGATFIPHRKLHIPTVAK